MNDDDKNILRLALLVVYGSSGNIGRCLYGRDTEQQYPVCYAVFSRFDIDDIGNIISRMLMDGILEFAEEQTISYKLPVLLTTSKIRVSDAGMGILLNVDKALHGEVSYA
jgi:hypothetical protein